LKRNIYRICIIVIIIDWLDWVSLSVFHFLLLPSLVLLPRFLGALYLLLFLAGSMYLMWRAGVMLDETVGCCFLSKGHAVGGLSCRSFLSM